VRICIDLTASSAVNLPITRASLRLVVVWMEAVNPEDVLRSVSTAAVDFHNKFYIFHVPSKSFDLKVFDLS